MNHAFSPFDIEEALAAVRGIVDADARRTLTRILCGASFEPLRTCREPAIDWDVQPPWAMYAAMDADGGWWVYSVDIEPDEYDAAWTAADADGIEVERMTDPPEDWVGDWHESRSARHGTS